LVRLEIRDDSPLGRGLVANERAPSPTILLVDDAAIRNGIRRHLEQAGYTVLTAATSVEAIEHAADNEVAIHLLLTDFVLPGITGRQVADVIMRGRPGFRVLYMSGHNEEDIAAQGHAHPGAAFLQKPFAVGTLLQRMRELLDPWGGKSASAGGE
jgi:two-component system cell cycle sensor histidine kinase/response regulator CckA